MTTKMLFRIPNREGILLNTLVFRPATSERLPTLLHRTPYNAAEQFAGGSLKWQDLVNSGFNLVVQDVRGRFGSDGVFVPYLHEANDGFDTIAWITNQPWSCPEVGMLGRSYAAMSQWAAAASPQGTSSLKAIAPEVASSSCYHNWTYQGGAFRLEFCLRWVLEDLAVPTQQFASEEALLLASRLKDARNDIANIFTYPWQILELLESAAPYYREWLQHAVYDDYWKLRSAREHIEQMRVPALIVGGWFDPFILASLRDFTIMQHSPRSERARNETTLIVGPWDHSIRDGILASRSPVSSAITARDYLTWAHKQWFRKHLQGDTQHYELPQVSLLVMGVNVWRYFDSWPPPNTYNQKWFLNADAQDLGDLRISPAMETTCGSYVHDPRAIISSAALQKHDCATEHFDKLVSCLRFFTEPFEKPLTVIGYIRVTLFISSTNTDVDFCAKLFDIDPHSEERMLCSNISRTRLYEERPTFDAPKVGTVCRKNILVGATANVFLTGHRILLEISGSSFPEYDLNTGGNNFGFAPERLEIAKSVNTISYGGSLASYLEIPIINEINSDKVPVTSSAHRISSGVPSVVTAGCIDI